MARGVALMGDLPTKAQRRFLSDCAGTANGWSDDYSLNSSERRMAFRLVRAGLLEYAGDGFRITAAGRDALEESRQ